MNAKIYPPIILAESECLAVSTVIDAEGVISLNENVTKSVNDILKGEILENVINKYGIYNFIKAVTVIYGGILLFYKCGPVTPLSRVHSEAKINIYKASYGRRIIDDTLILKAWALIYSGLENKGLQLISGPLISPKGYYWTPGRQYEVLVVGIEH